jgi:hypothetical protein
MLREDAKRKRRNKVFTVQKKQITAEEFHLHSGLYVSFPRVPFGNSLDFQAWTPNALWVKSNDRPMIALESIVPAGLTTEMQMAYGNSRITVDWLRKPSLAPPGSQFRNSAAFAAEAPARLVIDARMPLEHQTLLLSLLHPSVQAASEVQASLERGTQEAYKRSIPADQKRDLERKVRENLAHWEFINVFIRCKEQFPSVLTSHISNRRCISRYAHAHLPGCAWLCLCLYVAGDCSPCAAISCRSTESMRRCWIRSQK